MRERNTRKDSVPSLQKIMLFLELLFTIKQTMHFLIIFIFKFLQKGTENERNIYRIISIKTGSQIYGKSMYSIVLRTTF